MVSVHNMTNATLPLPKLNGYNLFKAIFFYSSFSISIIGNLNTICFILKLYKRSKNSYILLHKSLLQLALADINVAIFLVLNDAIMNTVISWHGGRWMCKFIKLWQAFSLCLSTYVVVFISVDRVVAIGFPLMHNKCWKRNFNIIIFIICISTFVLSLPQVVIHYFVQILFNN